jgi:4-amino-4-deoxy-L-arabinose transferase-like glycosyltransferase
MRAAFGPPRQAVLWLILAATLVRLGFAWSLGLGVDESYMVAAGRVFSFGYFDHPPASWWLSWGSAQVFGESSLTVRLPFIFLSALSTWLLFRLGSAAFGERAGLWAAAAFTMSPVLGMTSATWVLPDGPLDCALLGSALCLMHALGDRGRAWWLGAGVCAGLALLSKYSAVLTIAGAFLFLLSSRPHRHWLTRPEPYLAALIAFALFSPVIVWNATHGWASFAFQGARAGAARFRPLMPLTTLAGEALFILPWIWAPMMVAFIMTVRRGPGEWRGWLLCCLGTPPIFLFTLISAWSSQRVLFHWAAPGYLMLFPLLGALIVRLLDRGSLATRRVLAGTAIFAFAVLAILSLGVRFDLLHPVVVLFHSRTDPMTEAVDWTSLRTELVARDLLHRPGTVIAAPSWREAGKVGYGLGGDVAFTCLNRDCRQFGFVRPAAGVIGQDVLLIVPEHADRVQQELASLFDSLEVLPPLELRYRGRQLQQVGLLLGHRLKYWPPAD